MILKLRLPVSELTPSPKARRSAIRSTVLVPMPLSVGPPVEPEVYNAHTFLFAQEFLPLEFAVTCMLTNYKFTVLFLRIYVLPA